MKNFIIALFGVTFVTFLVWLIINHMKKMTLGSKTYNFKNHSTAGYISTLHPYVQSNFANFVEEVESPENGDLEIDFTRTFSTPEEQQKLYDAGETPTKVSLHNFGLAGDINVTGTDKSGNKVNLMMNSPSAKWLPIVDIAKKHNLTWGGTFKNTPVPDRVHFQYAFAKKASQYLADYNAGNRTESGYVSVV